MTEGYQAIARVYDKLNQTVDYAAWADAIEAAFDAYLPQRPELVLDLACGTGSMTRELASRGYDMIGVDGSADMLACAYERKEESRHPEKILFLEQDMRSFELYGTVGAVVCCLDSLNYLTGDGELKTCFSLVHNYLDPNGLFLFDMNTPYKFASVYGDNAYILEDEENGRAVFCGWQNEYDAEKKICTFYLSLFEEDKNGKYLRYDETQQERCYTKEEILSALEESGFAIEGIFADVNRTPIDETTERWYIAARALKPMA